jgi:hypothetical protein
MFVATLFIRRDNGGLNEGKALADFFTIKEHEQLQSVIEYLFKEEDG